MWDSLISVGNVGIPAGKSSVIVHTDFGKEVFESALQWGFIEAKPIDKSGADLIHKMMNEREERSRDCREGEEDEEVDGTVTGT